MFGQQECAYGIAPPKQTGTANHGSFLDARRLFGARSTGIVSREEPARLHHGADDDLSSGSEKALRRTKRIGKANIFEAVVSRTGVQGNLINELLNLFGTRPVVAHMVKTGQLTLDDVRDAEQELKRLARKEQSK